jgi:hypothetical protein
VTGVRAVTVALYVLPFATAAVVGFALFVVGAQRPYVGARLYGGPTENAPRLSFRLEVVERYRGVEGPLTADAGPFTVDARFQDGSSARWTGQLDSLGMASVTLEPPGGVVRGAAQVRVLRPGAEPIAEGQVWLPIAAWLARAERHGGWLDVPSKGELKVRVALARGALAVPFAEAIWIEVTRGGRALAGAKLRVEPEGVRLVRPSARDTLIDTDAAGRVAIVVAPREHNVALSVVVEQAGARGEWYSRLPVVPGAYSVTLVDRRLRIESPVARDVAFFALLTDRARIAGGPVQLDPDGRGGAVQIVDVGPLPDQQIWAQVSSEPELASAATVGWPLRVPATPVGDPPNTFQVPDHLLLDGLGMGARAELQRRSKARAIAAGFTLIALLLASLIVIVRTRSADARLRAHLQAAGEQAASRDLIAQKRAGARVALAVLCIALGFAVIAMAALYGLS